MSKFLQACQGFIKMCANSTNFMRNTGAVRLLSAEDGRISLEFDVTPEMTNPLGTLHGGCTATFIDNYTTAVIIGSVGRPAVSVDLHITYLAPAKIGDTIILDASIVKAGKQIMFTKAELYHKDSKKMIAYGLQTLALPYIKPKEKE